MQPNLKVIPSPVTAARSAPFAPAEVQIRPRLIRTALAVGAALALGVSGVLWAWPIGEPEHLGALQGDVWRGAYLARASGCVSCHTAPGGQALAGGAPLETPFGTFVPPNITPDPEGGIGEWTLDEFAVAVRQGVAPEGHAYYPAFVYEFYQGFSDQDVADLFAAIQSVPPAAERAPDHDVSFPFNLRFGLKLWRAAFMTEPYVTPTLGRSELWNRGQALVEGPTHCAACHTGRNLLGGLQADEAMAGSDDLPGGSVAPSIRTADLLERGWTPSSLAYALRTGLAPDGDALGGSMAEVVHAGTSFLDEADREAIAAYIMDVDDIGSAESGATAPEGAPADGMAGMDHEGMAGMEDGTSSATGSAEPEAMTGMEEMDHSSMSGMSTTTGEAPASGSAPVEPGNDVQANARVQQSGTLLRPRLRPW